MSTQRRRNLLDIVFPSKSHRHALGDLKIRSTNCNRRLLKLVTDQSVWTVECIVCFDEMQLGAPDEEEADDDEQGDVASISSSDNAVVGDRGSEAETASWATVPLFNDKDPPTAECNHCRNVCDDCLERTYETSIRDGQLDDLTCPDPECRQPVGLNHLRDYVSQECFNL